MKTAKAETTSETTLNEVMSKLYRAMAVAQAQMIVFLSEAKDDEDLKIRTAVVMEALETIEFVGLEKQCENGTIWNPITQRCE